MALGKINKNCAICSKELPLNEQVVYIGKVHLTDDTRSNGYGNRHRIPADKLRIRHLGSSNPKLGVHVQCFEDKMASFLKGNG